MYQENSQNLAEFEASCRWLEEETITAEVAPLVVHTEVVSEPKTESPWCIALAGAPEFWKYTPIGDNKAPIDPKTGRAADNWQNKPFSLQQIAAMNGVVKAVGLISGPHSETLAVDFDGPGSDLTFKHHLERDVAELPPTVAWTSGKPSRQQMAFRVPMKWWHRLKGKRNLTLDGNGTVELRWSNHQSVVTGHHPETGAYRWVDGCGPSEQQFAVAPEWLLEALVKPVAVDTEEEATESQPWTSVARARDFLKHALQPASAFADYETWLAIGMELQATSAAAGRPDVLLPDFLSWCEEMGDAFDEEECLHEWQRWSDKGQVEGQRTFRSLVHRVQKLGYEEPAWPPAVRQPGSFLWRVQQASLRAWANALRKQLRQERGHSDPQEYSYVMAGQSIIQKLEIGWQKIALLGRPAERAAAKLKLSDELGVSGRQMDALVREMLEEQNDDNSKFSTFASVMTGDFSADPLVEGLLARARLTLIGGLGGTCKSTMCYEIAEAVTTGGMAFDSLRAAPGKVLIYQCDESASDARVKWDRMNLQPDNDRLRIQWGFTAAMLPDLERRIVEEQIDLVILDSLTTIFAGGDAKMTDAEIGLPLYHLNKLASRTGAGILLTHHLKKTDSKNSDKPRQPTKNDMFGSAFVTNATSDALGVWEMGKELNGDPVYGLVSLKCRSGLMSTGQLYQLEGNRETWRAHLRTDVGENSIAVAREVKDVAVAFLRTHIGEWFTANEIAAQLPDTRDAGFSVRGTRTLTNVLIKLAAEGYKTGVRKRPSKRGPGSRGKTPNEYSIQL